MSVKPLTLDVQEFKTTQSYSELYRELELMSLRPSSIHLETGQSTNKINIEKVSRNICSRFTKWKRCFFENQAEALHNAMMLAIITGQCVGLFPVVGILDKNFLNVRLKICSLRFIFSSLTLLLQTIASGLSLYRLLTNSITVSRIGYFSFYATTWMTTIVFLQHARKWKCLLKKVYAAELNDYIDPDAKFKCNVATIVFLICASLEHTSSLISEVSTATDCFSLNDNVFERFIRRSYSWVFEVGIPYHISIGVALLVFGMASTIIWSYSHLFIICISIYLYSILEQIIKKVESHDGRNLPSENWRRLREDYSRATKLVRSFDDVVNSVVFVTFASDLFFVCFRLYFIFAHGFGRKHTLVQHQCGIVPRGPYGGYEFVMYLSISLLFIIARSLAVCLMAARLHSVSLRVAPILYNVPSPSYCLEVQRFLEQVHGDTVALSGLKFFYVTKELVLTIAGTIVTYELVLLQING